LAAQAPDLFGKVRQQGGFEIRAESEASATKALSASSNPAHAPGSKRLTRRAWPGNWRLTFAFENGDAILVDDQDHH
jgi:hypothetical protein